jgi:coenzyme F420 hydrogenase subunit beta
LIAQATQSKIREKATDGGIVTALLHYMLDKKIIDGAVVAKKTGNPFEREPIIATKLEDLLSAAGSTFSDLAHVNELGKYNTYSPSLYALKTLKNTDLARIAVVGTPCQIHTIRKMQILRILPSHIVKFTIGLFCMENFSFDQKAREEFEKQVGFNLENVTKMNIKEDIIFNLKNGKSVHIPFEAVEPLVRPACIACTDFSNDFSDISVGGLGSPAGFTTTLLRTGIGAQMFEDAVNAGYIKVQSIKNRKDWNVERTKTLANIINFAERKRQRGLKRLNKLSIVHGGF